VVNLGFVLNVIEAPDERLETLRDAWSICRKLLIVAARIAGGDWLATGGQYGDGVVTRLGTFQKLYGQSELREYIQAVLQAEALPAAPGVFYVFRDQQLSQRYLASRYRRRATTQRILTSQRRFEQHRACSNP
jgi:DNA phosphorothioation-associated putative methyltransferase